MRRVSLILMLCLAGIMVCTTWSYGQDTSTPVPAPMVSSGEKKPATPAQDKWEFELLPYLWMAGLSGDVTVKGNQANISMSFGDIWDNLKFGAQLHMEAKKDKWGLFLDTTYMNLDTSIDGARYRTGPDGRLQVEKYLDADISFDEWLIEFGGTYQLAKIPLGQDKGGMMYLDLLGGGRYWYLSTDIDVGLIVEDNGNVVSRSISPSGSKQWIDPFIGLRTRFQLTKNLMMAFRGDVGGFSVGSKFTWNASGYIGYSLSEMVSLWAGYRALGVNYQSGSGSSKFVYDVTMQGPAIGMGFRF